MYQRTYQNNQTQSKTYMQELSDWIEGCVIDPLVHAAIYGPDQAVDDVKIAVAKAIREKVLESYHNGQKSGPRKQARH